MPATVYPVSAGPQLVLQLLPDFSLSSTKPLRVPSGREMSIRIYIVWPSVPPLHLMTSLMEITKFLARKAARVAPVEAASVLRLGLTTIRSRDLGQLMASTL